MYHDYFLIFVLSRLSLYNGLRLYILLVAIAAPGILFRGVITKF